MNLLKNKELLRGLLYHADLFNTINGGIVQANSKVVKREDGYIITVTAASIPAESFNVILNFNELLVFSTLQNEGKLKDDQLTNIPVILETFALPKVVNADRIEAVHKNGELRIYLPFDENIDSLSREIDIKHIK